MWMPRLLENERNQIIGHLQVGSSISHVTRLFNVWGGTVYGHGRRYQATGSTRDMPRSGHPMIMTPRSLPIHLHDPSTQFVSNSPRVLQTQSLHIDGIEIDGHTRY